MKHLDCNCASQLLMRQHAARGVSDEPICWINSVTPNCACSAVSRCAPRGALAARAPSEPRRTREESFCVHPRRRSSVPHHTQMLSCALAASAAASAFIAHPQPPVQARRASIATMLEVEPAEIAGILGITSAALLGLRFVPGSPFYEADDETDADSDSARIAGLEDRIRQARASQAQTYREVGAGGTEDTSDEAQLRRQRVLARAQGMLDGAREAVQEGLDEALLNQDYDTAEEYLQMLEKMRPLPTGIVPTSDGADFKRWLDDKSL